MRECMYKNEKVSKLYKKRAEKFMGNMPGVVELDPIENVWCFNTAVQSNYSRIHTSILFYEEAVVFRVLFDIPEKMNNDIFKMKVLKKNEHFEVLDEYPSRILLVGTDSDDVLLMLNIAYLYEEADYDINKVADILIHVGKDISASWDEYIDSQLKVLVSRVL